MVKKRLDVLLVERGLVEAREKAQALIMAGEVTVNGTKVTKPGAQVDESSELNVRQPLPYVSRGGLKLEHALKAFALDVTGKVALDGGASTGGFTDCLLKHGASKVYAVDVGYGQLDWRLRADPRVVAIDRTNLRYLDQLPEKVAVVTVDVSFISLRLVLPAVANLMQPDALVVALVKPQFEAGREHVGKGGVVKNPATHKRVLRDLLEWATANGWKVLGLTPSPVLGPAGNREFLMLLARNGWAAESLGPDAVDTVVDSGITVALHQQGGGA